MKRFKVATTQLHVRHMDVERNLEAHFQLIGRAADADCDLVVFPELSVTGHNGTPEITRGAEPSDGPIYRAIHDKARSRKIIVAYGFCEHFRGTHYNAHALVGPDGMIGIQRKVHASFDEFFRFRQAYEWSVFDLGYCRIGTAICHDSDFFESWRVLSLKGAEVLLLPPANAKSVAAGGPSAHRVSAVGEHRNWKLWDKCSQFALAKAETRGRMTAHAPMVLVRGGTIPESGDSMPGVDKLLPRLGALAALPPSESTALP